MRPSILLVDEHQLDLNQDISDGFEILDDLQKNERKLLLWLSKCKKVLSLQILVTF